MISSKKKTPQIQAIDKNSTRTTCYPALFPKKHDFPQIFKGIKGFSVHAVETH
jgi:hypothetical protein